MQSIFSSMQSIFSSAVRRHAEIVQVDLPLKAVGQMSDFASTGSQRASDKAQTRSAVPSREKTPEHERITENRTAESQTESDSISRRGS